LENDIQNYQTAMQQNIQTKAALIFSVKFRPTKQAAQSMTEEARTAKGKLN